MAADSSRVPDITPVVLLTTDNEDRYADVAVGATRDHQLIQRWAAQHQAEPATGEYTASGAGTVQVNDGGAGIRFNFPAVSRFRPITWDEWFENFEAHELVFLYDRDTAGGNPSYRYKLVKMDTLRGGPVLL